MLFTRVTALTCSVRDAGGLQKHVFFYLMQRLHGEMHIATDSCVITMPIVVCGADCILLAVAWVSSTCTSKPTLEINYTKSSSGAQPDQWMCIVRLAGGRLVAAIALCSCVRQIVCVSEKPRIPSSTMSDPFSLSSPRCLFFSFASALSCSGAVPEALKLCAARVAAGEGDARKALQALRLQL